MTQTEWPEIVVPEPGARESYWYMRAKFFSLKDDLFEGLGPSFSDAAFTMEHHSTFCDHCWLKHEVERHEEWLHEDEEEK